MAVNQTRFQAYLEQELKKYRGVYVPTKSGILRRMLIRKASCEKLHPNPHDAFCDPKVGPAYEIVSNMSRISGRHSSTPRQTISKSP